MKSPFVLIEDATEADSLIQEGARMCSGSIVWTKNRNTLIQTNMMPVGRSLLKDSIYLWIPRNLEIKPFLEDLKSTEEGFCYINTSTTRAHLFYRTRLQFIEKEALIFHRPEQLYKIQRRANFRLPVPDGYIIRASFPSPIEPDVRLEYKVFDISSGGLSLILPMGLESRFHRGAILTDLTFKLRGQLIRALGEIRYIENLTLHPTLTGSKMGIQFRHISAEDAKIVTDYVNQESRKYFSRFF